MNILSAIRLNNTNPRGPGLLKFAVGNLEQKKKILQTEGNLKHSHLKHIFLRSSKNHTERILEQNTRTCYLNLSGGKTLD